MGVLLLVDLLGGSCRPSITSSLPARTTPRPTRGTHAVGDLLGVPTRPREDGAGAAPGRSILQALLDHSVADRPGCTELQRILSLACWMAVDLCRTAPLVALYAAVSPGLSDQSRRGRDVDDGPPGLSLAGIAHLCRGTRLDVTAMMRSQSASLVSSIFDRKRIRPLLTSTSSCRTSARPWPRPPAVARGSRSSARRWPASSRGADLGFDLFRRRRARRRTPRPRLRGRTTASSWLRPQRASGRRHSLTR